MSSPKFLSSKFGHVIDGEISVIPSGAKMMNVINPATEESIAEVPIATKKELDQAVDAAHKAQKEWAKKSFAERGEIISKWGKAYEETMEDLVELLIAEQGKSRMVADFEVKSMPKWFQGTSKVWDGADEVIQDTPEQKIVSKFSPLGVAGAIVPWNFPVILSLWKIIPCLYTGNAMIVKPSPFTPLCNIKIVEQAQQFLPKGLLQVVVGDDQLGPWVTEHPGIQKISFTGSTATGRLVARSCSATLKRLTLELGGNDVSIILPDVDVAAVAPAVLFSALMNSGQFCAASKRVFLHEKIYDEFSKALVEAAKASKVGPGHEADTAHGPINNKMQFDKVSEYFEDSKKNGHKFLVGGDIPKSKGYFVPLTLVDNPPDNSRVVAEEPFGPIVPLLKWSDEADLLKRVNDSEYGLGATLWGKDSATVERIATAIESGTVWVNQVQSFDPLVPFGGVKNSGVGCENGLKGLKSYCNEKIVVYAGSASQ